MPLLRANFRAYVLAHRQEVREAARSLGTNDSTFHRWETGASVPTVKNIERLAGELGIHPLMLLMSAADLELWTLTRALVKAADTASPPPAKD